MSSTYSDDTARFRLMLSGPQIFQTFDDRAQKDPRLSRILHDPAGLAELNAQGAGVFLMVNEGDGRGRKTVNVTRVRAYFADFDTTPLPQVWPLAPSMIVETSPGKFQAYWPLRENEVVPLDNDAWNAQQQAIARAVGSQPDDCKGLNRVMRLPGYLHQKGQPFTSRIVSMTGERFTFGQIQTAFPLPVVQARSPAQERPTQTPEGSKPGMLTETRRKYALTALYGLTDELSATTEGGRNNKLNALSFRAGRLIGGGHLERGEVEAELTRAAQGAGLPNGEISGTLHNGLTAGMANPDLLEHVRDRFSLASTIHHTISPSGAKRGAGFSPPHQTLGSGVVVQRTAVEIALNKYRAKLGKKFRGLL